MRVCFSYDSDHVNALYDISYLLSRVSSDEEMFKIAIEKSISELNIDRMAIFLLNDGRFVQGTYGTDIKGNVVNEAYFSSLLEDHPFASEMINNRIYISFQHNTQLKHESKTVGFGWNGFVTLWDGYEPIGWIACDNLINGRELEQAQVHTLQILSFIVSQSIVRAKHQKQLSDINQMLKVKNQELAHLTSRLEELVLIDPLTQIANRRGLERYLQSEGILAGEIKGSLAVLMIDIDNFKLINDVYGHSVGDKCIRAIAKLLNDLVSEENFILARYGGEEFIFVLLGVSDEQVKNIAKLILQKVRSLVIEGVQSFLTVSVGGSFHYCNGDVRYTELVKMADENLYQAKSLGKDREVITFTVTRSSEQTTGQSI